LLSPLGQGGGANPATVCRSFFLDLVQPLLLIPLLAVTIGSQATASERTVTPGESLQQAIRQAAPGDTLILSEGRHAGPVTIDRSLILRGRPGSIIDGGREGSVIAVRADDVRIESLTIRNSGLRLQRDEAGIHSTGANTAVADNRIESCLHGIYFREVRGGRITGNTVLGATGGDREAPFDALTVGAPVANQPGLCAVGQLNENRRGNGIHLWSSSEVRIEGNRVARTRDGIYFSFADRCEVSHNEVRETRYGLHYMYSDENHFHHNHFSENGAGAALMYSGDLRVEENRFTANRGRRAYGMLLQSVDNSTFTDNEVFDNTIGIYAENSQNNRFIGNRLHGNYVAFLMGGSSADNILGQTHFARNWHSVEVDGSTERNQWHASAGGNRWQGSPEPDLDGDSRGDFVHRELDLLGSLRRDFPVAGLLSGSAGLEVLRFAASRSGANNSRVIVDPRPLIRPIETSWP
jgi:nitrous oxidase accessory protein